MSGFIYNDINAAKYFIDLCYWPSRSKKMKDWQIIEVGAFCKKLKFESLAISNNICILYENAEFEYLGHYEKAKRVYYYCKKIYNRRRYYDIKKNGKYSAHRYYEERGHARAFLAKF